MKEDEKKIRVIGKMIRWELEKEVDKQYVVFTVEPIHKDVKFIFTDDYFRRLGCIVHVDSGDVPLYEKTLVTEQEEEGVMMQKGGAGNAFSFTAGWIYKVLGPLIERVKNGYEPQVDDTKKIVSVRLSDSKQLAQVPVHSKQATLNKQPFVVETVNPTRQSIETNLYIIEQNKAAIEENKGSQALVEKLEAINQKLEEENQRLQQFLDQQLSDQQQTEDKEKEKEPPISDPNSLPPVIMKDDLFPPEEPATTTLQEGVKKYVGSLHETVDELRPSSLGSKFAQDPHLPAMRIKIQYFNCSDKGGYGLSGFMTGTEFEEAMQKQKGNEHMLEVSETTQGRTMQQKKKEEQDAEEQWFMKNGILNASENRLDILQKYSYLKSKDNVYQTVSETLSGLVKSITPSTLVDVNHFDMSDIVPESQQFSSIKRSKEEAKAKQLEEKKAKEEKEKQQKEEEEKAKEEKEKQEKEKQEEEKKVKEEKEKQQKEKEEEEKKAKEEKEKEKEKVGGSVTSHKALKEELVEVFYIYASEGAKVATQIDFRLFPDLQLLTSK